MEEFETPKLYRVLPRGVASEHGLSTGIIYHNDTPYESGDTLELVSAVALVHRANIEAVDPDTTIASAPTAPTAPTAPAATVEGGYSTENVPVSSKRTKP